MEFGTDDAQRTADELQILAERAVCEIARVWACRKMLATPSAKSALARLIRGESRHIDPTTIGSPSLFRSWLITVEIAGRATRAELGFDGLLLIVEIVSSGKRFVDVGSGRGWRRNEVSTNFRKACWALAMQFASRGVTRSLEPETDESAA